MSTECTTLSATLLHPLHSRCPRSPGPTLIASVLTGASCRGGRSAAALPAHPAPGRRSGRLWGNTERGRGVGEGGRQAVTAVSRRRERTRPGEVGGPYLRGRAAAHGRVAPPARHSAPGRRPAAGRRGRGAGGIPRQPPWPPAQTPRPPPPQARALKTARARRPRPASFLGLSKPGNAAARQRLIQSPAPLPSSTVRHDVTPASFRFPTATATGRGGAARRAARQPRFSSPGGRGSARGVTPMAGLVRAVGRALLARAAPLLRAERSVSGGGARWGPVRPGLPVPLSSPLAGLTRAFRIKEPPKPKQVDRWTKKRALFGVYDNVGILGKAPRCGPRAGGEGGQTHLQASGSSSSERVVVGIGASRPGNSLLQGLASSSLLCPPVLRRLPDPPEEPHRGAPVAARLAGERAAEVHPQEAGGGRSDVCRGLPQTQQEDPVLVQALQSYREAPLGETTGSAHGAWFCGIAVRIKPAFTQLGSQCFL